MAVSALPSTLAPSTVQNHVTTYQRSQRAPVSFQTKFDDSLATSANDVSAPIIVPSATTSSTEWRGRTCCRRGFSHHRTFQQNRKEDSQKLNRGRGLGTGDLILSCTRPAGSAPRTKGRLRIFRCPANATATPASALHACQ